MHWHKLKDKIYFRDGSYRDIVVQETTRADWEKWTNYVNENHKISWLNPKEDLLQNRIDFDVISEYWDGNTELLSTAHIFLDKIQVNAHFFQEEEIENDITPTEFNSINDHYKLTKYMSDLAMILDKEIRLTEENMHDSILILVTKNAVHYI